MPSRLSETTLAFLLIELDTARTFLDLADTTTIGETARSNYWNELDVYDTIMRLLQRVTLDHEQSQTIEEKLAKLRARLNGAGYQV